MKLHYCSQSCVWTCVCVAHLCLHPDHQKQGGQQTSKGQDLANEILYIFLVKYFTYSDEIFDMLQWNILRHTMTNLNWYLPRTWGEKYVGIKFVGWFRWRNKVIEHEISVRTKYTPFNRSLFHDFAIPIFLQYVWIKHTFACHFTSIWIRYIL